MKEKRSKDFGSYISNRFGETSIPGIATISQASGCFQRSVRIIILGLALAGFLYQTFTFLQFYWQYSTVLSQSQLKDMKRPSITICDENLTRRKYFCETKPDACIDAWILDPTSVYIKTQKQNICSLFAHYCLDVPWNTSIPLAFARPKYYLTSGKNYLKVPKGYVVEYEDSYLDINFTKEYGFQIEDALVSCEWIYDDASGNDASKSSSFPCSKFEFARAINTQRKPAACYTLKPNTARSSFQLENLGRNTRLRMALRWRSYDLNDRPPNIDLLSEIPPALLYYVSFHHPGQLTNPFTQGIKIQGGKRYEVQVKELDFTRLPAPYSSDCYDYMEDWNKHGGSVPLRKEDCMMQCEIDVNFEKHGCVPRSVTFPHEKKLCVDMPHFDFMINTEIQECLKRCRDACFEIKYEAEAEILGAIPTEESFEKYETATAVSLDINFNVQNSKIIADKPKYESIELFSYIGGYMGMWLGWCLVAVCEFFEILYYMCKYFSVRKSKKRQRPIRRRKHFSTDYYGY